jgi:hypothetical protein
MKQFVPRVVAHNFIPKGLNHPPIPNLTQYWQPDIADL